MGSPLQLVPIVTPSEPQQPWRSGPPIPPIRPKQGRLQDPARARNKGSPAGRSAAAGFPDGKRGLERRGFAVHQFNRCRIFCSVPSLIRGLERRSGLLERLHN